MINYQLFPRSIGLSTELERIVQCFDAVNHIICSDANNLSSNEVLSAIRSNLEDADFLVETGKSNKDKIHVPVLFGHNNKIDKSFYADALSRDGKIVIEVEAGRATENNQFLKDIFQACMMHKVEYLVIAVRNIYRGHADFDIVYSFLETLYISSRLHLPLKGILLVGY
jgi:hypothetical protein